MITEAEAKEKWCPQARKAFGKHTDTGKWAPIEHISGHNVVHILESPNGVYKSDIQRAQCCGSQCMAWRWAERSGCEVPLIGEVKDRKGYCGAYGKPEFGDRDD